MTTLHHRTAISLCALLVVSGLCCTSADWQSPAEPSPQAQPQQTAFTTNPVTPDVDADLRLFGQVGTAQTVSFEGRLASNAQQHTEPAEGADFDPDLDPVGKFIVFASTRHSRYSHLYLKPIGGTTLTQITDQKGNDAQPRFSPDGSRIAFASDRSGQWDIWVVDANGRNPVQITRHNLPELHPSWSPDGNRLVYCRIDPKGNRSEMWVVDMRNPGVKRVIGEGMFPTWSPKGDKIAYQRARSRGSRKFSLWTLEIDENNDALFPTEIASNAEAALIAPDWSPDATQLTFAAVAPSQRLPAADGTFQTIKRGYSDIGVVDADGRGLIRLTGGRGENYSPVWANDGRIYFISRAEDKEMIWSVKPYQPVNQGTPNATTGDETVRAASSVMRPAID